MKTITKTSLAFFCMILAGCSKNPSVPGGNCEKAVTIEQALYEAASISNYMLTDAVINGDCLELKFGSSGCDGSNWVITLVDAGVVVETNPVQRFLKLVLTNNELCDAVIAKTVSFDITPLRINNSNSILIVLAGLNKTLLYTY